jgi:hypothetical protein
MWQDVKGNVPENSDETESPLVLVNKVKDLNEKLCASLAESNAKDDLVRHHTKDAEEAVSGKIASAFSLLPNSFHPDFPVSLSLVKQKSRVWRKL